MKQMKRLLDDNIDNQNGAKILDLQRKKPILVYPEGYTGKKVSKKIAVPAEVDYARAEATLQSPRPASHESPAPPPNPPPRLL